MNWKRIMAAILCTLIPTLSAVADTGEARGHLWYDKNAHVAQFGKLVIFPIIDLDGSYWMNDQDVKSAAYKANNYLNTRFIRKFKVKTTIPLGAMIDENKKIRVKDSTSYMGLLNTKFSSEKERAAEVTKVTAAPGYFVPRTRQRRTEPHQSPATTKTVQMHSYTKEWGGPNGERIYNERKWTENYTIPAKELMLYHMDIEHTLYNRNGDKILTYENQEHSYDYNMDNYRQKMFESLIDEFKDDYGDIRKEYLEDKKNPREKQPIKIGFKGIQVPNNVGSDEYLIKSVYFTMKNFALKYTNADIIFDDTSNVSPRYYVQGVISRYSLDRQWIPPYVVVTDHEILGSRRESKWYDRDGNEHTKKTADFKSGISHVFGKWVYKATVAASFSLVDAKTGQAVLTHSATETDDKCADAYRHFMKDFYGKVKKYIGK